MNDHHAGRLVLILLVCFVVMCGGCSSGGGGSSSGAPAQAGSPGSGSSGTPEASVQKTFPWVEGTWTQEVPSWGSPVRLSLPVAVEDLAFDSRTAIGGFGIHAGGHVEGMDHVWIHIRPDVPVRSWGDGTVTSIENMGPAGEGLTEYFITIDYGQGLIGKHMEVQTPLVVVGQTVRQGDPVAIGLPWGEWRSAEFSLSDHNRSTETGYGVGGAVSPFDYLKTADKEALIARYVAEVVNPRFRSGQPLGDSKPWEPYLTNRHLIHPFHRGTIVGEWLLANKGWKDPEPVYYDMMSVLDNTNDFGSYKVFAMLDESLYGPGTGMEGTWSAPDGPGKIIFNGGSRILYGLYVIDESGGRARLTLEWQEGSYPERLTENAAVYVERASLPRRSDARDLGRLP